MGSNTNRKSSLGLKTKPVGGIALGSHWQRLVGWRGIGFWLVNRQEILIEPHFHFPHCLLKAGRRELAFPYHNHLPAVFVQNLVVLTVAFTISVDFCLPKRSVALRHTELVSTIVAMPKTSIHKDGCAVTAQYHIGFAGHAAHIEPVTVASLPQPLAHLQLRLGVSAVNMRHTSMTLFGC